LIENHIVKIANIEIGGQNPIVAQSMTNTNTLDTQASVNQIIELVNAGSKIVRLTCRSIKEAENLKNIKELLIKNGIRIPLVADTHFSPAVAEAAAVYADKVRINPGNYIDKRRQKSKFTEEEHKEELIKIRGKLGRLIEICEENSTAVRIGVNHGSLSERMLFRYGNTARGMYESAMEFIKIFRELNFHNLVISLKASYVPTMMEANKLLHDEMHKKGFYYPIHLGVTEAGDGEEARVKSAAGIGSLLAEGIGDTIRVSLTENPIEEIPFADKLIEIYGKRQTLPMPYYELNRTSKPQIILKYNSHDEEELLINSSVDFTRLNESGLYKKLKIITNGEPKNELSDIILQALGIKYSKAEFIACPSCGRTLFNIIDELKKVKQKTSHLKGLKIAVMGCIVNGIGEMADADYGYVGAGAGKVNLYKQKQIISKNINESLAVDELIKIIKENGDWKLETE